MQTRVNKILVATSLAGLLITIGLLTIVLANKAIAADGGGHGNAYGCIQRSSQYVGGPTPYNVKLTNICAKAVGIRWCAKNPNASPSGWRCGSASPQPNQIVVSLDVFGVACQDSSCGEWTVEWNASYENSGETIDFPEQKDRAVTSGH
jgi:hypothetical protein